MSSTGIYRLMIMVLTASVLSVMAVTGFVLQFGIMNDYVFYNLQNATNEMVTGGMVTNTTAQKTLEVALAYQEVIFMGDNIWFAVYILFVFITLAGAYQLREYSEISFLMILMYGIIIVLFIGGIIEIFTNWFMNSITSVIVTGALDYFPKFMWYINNVGVISAVHAVALLIITRLNFNFAVKKGVNQQELQAIKDSDEVV